MRNVHTVDDALAASAPAIIESVNETHEDAALLVGRALGQRPNASATRVVALDRTGADFVVTDIDGEHALRCEFDVELADAATVTSALFALVRRARVESGETGTTSAERVMAELSGIRTFVTSVVRVENVHPHLRRIVFGGDDLAGFTSLGPDTFVFVLLPPPGRTELTVDATFTWEAHRETPEEERAVGAY